MVGIPDISMIIYFVKQILIKYPPVYSVSSRDNMLANVYQKPLRFYPFPVNIYCPKDLQKGRV